MSRSQFKEDCTGCKPVLLDIKTGALLPESSPEMRAIEKLWEQLPLEEKEAFHRVTCLNSRTSEDLRVMEKFAHRFRTLLAN